MIFKVALGAIFIVIGLDDVSDTTFLLFCFVLGLAFIAWGLVPYLQARRHEKIEETERILNTPIKGHDEKDEAERLAEKYYK